MQAGCSSAGADRQPATEADPAEGSAARDPLAARTFRGTYTFGHEVRAFRPCGSAESLWVHDQTGSLQTLHEELRPGTEPYEEIFVFVSGSTGPPPAEGFAADYDGEFTVAEVRYAAGEGLGCSHGWDFVYRAAGNEPFWSVTLDENALDLAEPGEPVRRWTDPEIDVADDITRVTVPSDTSIDIELRAVPCRDSMSGAFSAATATLRVRDRVLTGCAIPGESATTG